jgi:prophage antirepressor-like protein
MSMISVSSASFVSKEDEKKHIRRDDAMWFVLGEVAEVMERSIKSRGVPAHRRHGLVGV